MWTCCHCTTTNLDATAPEACPACQHYRCGYCVSHTGYSIEPARSSTPDCMSKQASKLEGHNLHPSQLQSTRKTSPPPLPNPSIAPSEFSGLGLHLCCPPSEHEMNETVPLVSSAYGDAWICCQCGAANIYDLAQRCPLCSHDACGYCSVG